MQDITEILVAATGTATAVLGTHLYFAMKTIKVLRRGIEDRQSIINAQWEIIEKRNQTIDELCKL